MFFSILLSRIEVCVIKPLRILSVVTQEGSDLLFSCW